VVPLYRTNQKDLKILHIGITQKMYEAIMDVSIKEFFPDTCE
jgi:hypothetical protein